MRTVTIDELSSAAATLLHREVDEPDTFVCKGTSDLSALVEKSQTLSHWQRRADLVRQGIRQTLGLDPPPARTPLRPRQRLNHTTPGYSVGSFAIEILPGLFGAGNLYRGSAASKRRPIVLLPHGHDNLGRFNPNQQHLAATLARLGCLALTYDMQGFGEAQQVDHDWPGMAALQTWQSMRMLDFALSLPEADRQRVACSGYSGGGTQTIFLTAVDARVSLSMPAVMVSAAFFGGCVCESGLPVHRNVVSGDLIETNNAEIAALASIGPQGPRPLLLISADADWTALTPCREYPFIKHIYSLFDGGEALVENVHLADVAHDYGPAKRQAAYHFIKKHFALGPDDDLDDASIEDQNEMLATDDLAFGAELLTTQTPSIDGTARAAAFFGLQHCSSG